MDSARAPLFPRFLAPALDLSLKPAVHPEHESFPFRVSLVVAALAGFVARVARSLFLSILMGNISRTISQMDQKERETALEAFCRFPLEERCSYFLSLYMPARKATDEEIKHREAMAAFCREAKAFLSPQQVKNALYHALDLQNPEVARVLIDRFQGDINETNRKGETLLFIAAQAGNLEVCQYLVGRGAKIDAMSNIERTPLMEALRYNRKEVAEFLIESGADCNSCNSYGISPILIAAGCSTDSGILAKLIDRGGDMNKSAYTHDGYYTALDNAIMGGKVENLKLLIRRGANVDNVGQDELGRPCSSVERAIRTNQPDCFQLLLDAGASFSLDMRKINSGKLSVKYLKLYIDSGLSGVGSLSPRKLEELIALYPIAKTPGSVRDRIILDYLKGGNFKITTENEEEILVAFEEVHKEFPKWSWYKKKVSIFPVFLIQKYPQLAKWYIRQGANVTNAGEDGITPLMAASMAGNLDLCKLIIEKGAEVPNDALVFAGTTDLREYFLRRGVIPSNVIRDLPEEEKREILARFVRPESDAFGERLKEAYLLGEKEPLRSCLEMGEDEIIAGIGEFKKDNLSWDVVNTTLEEKSFIEWASEKGYRTLAGELLEMGVKASGELLAHASSCGNLSLCNLLLQKGISPDGEGEFTPLIAAIGSGNTKSVRFFLERGAKVDTLYRQNTVLEYAIARGGSDTHDIEILKLLFDFGARYNNYHATLSSEQKRKLFLAYNISEKLPLLRDALVRVRLEGNDRAMPDGIISRTRLTDKEIVPYFEMMHKEFPHWDFWNFRYRNGYCPLLVTLSCNNMPLLVQWCLEKGADPNGRNSAGESALHKAAGSGMLDICRALVEKGADINQVNHAQKDALGIAVKHDRQEIVQFLLERNVPRINYLCHAKSNAVRKLLIERGAFIPVFYNCVLNPIEMESLVALFKIESDPIYNALITGYISGTAEPLNRLERQSEEEILRVASQTLPGWNIENWTVKGEKFILWATKHGHVRLTKFLAEKSAGHLDSALEIASQNGHLELVKYLLDRGCLPRKALWNLSGDGRKEILKAFDPKLEPLASHTRATVCKAISGIPDRLVQFKAIYLLGLEDELPQILKDSCLLESDFIDTLIRLEKEYPAWNLAGFYNKGYATLLSHAISYRQRTIPEAPETDIDRLLVWGGEVNGLKNILASAKNPNLEVVAMPVRPQLRNKWFLEFRNLIRHIVIQLQTQEEMRPFVLQRLSAGGDACATRRMQEARAMYVLLTGKSTGNISFEEKINKILAEERKNIMLGLCSQDAVVTDETIINVHGINAYEALLGRMRGVPCDYELAAGDHYITRINKVAVLCEFDAAYSTTRILDAFDTAVNGRDKEFTLDEFRNWISIEGNVPEIAGELKKYRETLEQELAASKQKWEGMTQAEIKKFMTESIVKEEKHKADLEFNLYCQLFRFHPEREARYKQKKADLDSRTEQKIEERLILIQKLDKGQIIDHLTGDLIQAIERRVQRKKEELIDAVATRWINIEETPVRISRAMLTAILHKYHIIRYINSK